MLVKISNLKMPIDASQEEVFAKAKKTLPATIGATGLRVLRRAIDARHGNVQFVYTVLAETKREFSCDNKNITPITQNKAEKIEIGQEKIKHPPIVVGFGPCGMFCALTLARQGYRPIVLERGADVDTRTQAVHDFWKTGTLNTNTNVQFGEGGAGTFSDGKLTTRIGDKLTEDILKEFVRHGAPEDILYNAMPHIGTDILKGVVKSIRQEIQELGGEIHFGTAVSDIVVQNGAIISVRLEDGGELPCNALILAIGHSARDTYEMLFSHGIPMVQKPFSVGFRVEHLRSDIDQAMYGKFAGNPLLGAAPYKLSYRENERGCYSFCMCPGGVVVNASSEEGRLVVNGMSESARDKINSNSAICVSVTGEDFGNSHPLGGIVFQRKLEETAFSMGGGDFCAPVQRLGDFMEDKFSKSFGKVHPSVLPGVRFANLNKLLPPQLCGFMKKGFSEFERKIKGFSHPDTLLTGVETRTSAPVRIVREGDFQSATVRGLYPAGEGAGYAGGIMSAATDGIKVARQVIRTYQPN